VLISAYSVGVGGTMLKWGAEVAEGGWRTLAPQRDQVRWDSTPGNGGGKKLHNENGESPLGFELSLPTREPKPRGSFARRREGTSRALGQKRKNGGGEGHWGESANIKAGRGGC